MLIGIIGIIGIIIIVLLYLYWTKFDIEHFSSNTTNMIYKPIDAISVIPDPIRNPTKLVVVITKDKFVWKYTIIKKNMKDLSLDEKRMASLRLIPGYPKLISEEWPIINNSYFHDGLNSISNTKISNGTIHAPELHFHKNRYKFTVNLNTGATQIRMTRGSPIQPNDTSPIDLNDGYDTIISNPDYTIPNKIIRNYIDNTYPALFDSGNNTYYTDSNVYLTPYDIYKDNKSYILELRKPDGINKVNTWVNNSNGKNKLRTREDYTETSSSLPEDIKNLSLLNYQGYHNLLLGQTLNNRIYTNDLYNCIFSVDVVSTTITRCNLWHQIKRSPRCAYSYPLENSRQIPAYVYVFDKSKVWKYKPINKTDTINTILALENGYPKLIKTEYPNIPTSFQNYIDAVWYNDNILFFVKGDNVLKYNHKTQTPSTTFSLNTLFPESASKYIESIVQVKEDDNIYLYLYSNNKYIKYSMDNYKYTKIGDWQSTTLNENRNDDFLMCGWYHPIIKSKVMTYMKKTIVGNNTYNNEDLYHAYSKTIILTDKASGMLASTNSNQTSNETEQNHLLIQQTIMGDIKAFGFKIDDDKIVKIENNDFLFQKFWDPIINKEIKDICGIIQVPQFNNMRFVFTNDKYYTFASSGTYNNDNYNMNLWAHTNNSDGEQTPKNFSQESKTIPNNFDFCFEDTQSLAWFFKDGYCWKFDTSLKSIVAQNTAETFFTNFDVANESAIFDWKSNRVLFIKGNVYSIYNYNISNSSLVTSNNLMFSLLQNEIAQNTSKEINAFSPVSTEYNKAYNMTESSLNINSLHNLIDNGNFINMENTNNLGTVTVQPLITDEPNIINSLPFEGKAVKYTMTNGTIMDITFNELYVSDIVFSFYIKKESSTPAFDINILTESRESTTQTVPVTNEWTRITQYQWQDFDYPFKVKITIANNDNKVFYASGFQLENNLHALPFFTGRVFHTWDETDPPEIAYVYNVNHLSTIPPQQGQLDIANMMSYNTLNQTRNDIGFEKEQAIYFDGKTVFMVIPTTSLKPTTVRQFSVSGWIRFRKFSTAPQYQSIYGVISPDGTFYYKVEEIGGKIRVIIKNAQTEMKHTFETVFIKPNKWYFIALTVSNEKLRFYAYNYYEDIDIDTRLLDMNIDTKILVGVPVDFENVIYKNYALNADVGSISIWRRELTPEDIKVLSRTFQNVKLALPEIKRKNLVGTGLAVPPLDIDISHIDGLGMCTYNCHIKWNKPKLPLDYDKLGYNIVKYDIQIKYYVGNNLVEKEQLEPYIKADKITKDVLQIKIFPPEIQCNNCTLVLVNIPYEYNYRVHIRYNLSNSEKSVWTDMDLKFKSNLVSRFGITGNTTCQNKIYQIDPKDKIKNEMKQNKFIEYSKQKIKLLKKF